MNDKSVIIFDFDGTIADSMALAYDLGNNLLADMGRKPVGMERVEKFRGMTAKQFFRALGIPFYRLPKLVLQARKLLHERIDDLNPIVGMPELIKELHAEGRTLGIITTNSDENVEKFLKNNDLRSYFTFIDGGAGAFGKARKLRSIVRKYDLVSADTIYVGDEIRDIEAARKAGLQVISVGWGLNNEKRLKMSKPDQYVDTPKALKKLLQ